MGNEHYFYFGNSFEFTPVTRDSAVWHGVDFGDNRWRMKVVLNFELPKVLRFHLTDTAAHSHADAGMHIHRIIRWR